MKFKSLLPILYILILTSWYSCKSKKSENQERKSAGKELSATSEAISARTLGLAYLEDNDLENAEKQFLKQTELAPSDASGYANLGVVYLRTGNLESAVKYLQKATELAPDDPDIRLNLAKAYDMLQENERSLEELKKIEEQSPEHVKTLYTIAEKLEITKNPESSAQWEKYMRKIVETSPKNIVARLYLTEALIRIGNSDEALGNLETMQQIFPEFSGEAKEYLKETMDNLRQNDTGKAITSFLIFHNFLKLTNEYQAGIRELKGAQGGTVGQPVITISQNTAILNENETILDVMYFADATEGANLDVIEIPGKPDKNQIAYALAITDINRDGDLDIYFAGKNQHGKSFRYLLKSDFGKFNDITSTSGIGHEGFEQFAQFADFDNDGFLDLLASANSRVNFYRNVNEGLFRNVSEKIHGRIPASSGVFFDTDHDGDLDLVLLTNGANILLRNDGEGNFEDVTAGSGLSGTEYHSTDIAFGDIDNDGDTDLIISNANGPTQIFENVRQGKFMDASVKKGERLPSNCSSIKLADFDNDGDHDLLVLSLESGASIYENDGAGTFKKSEQSRSVSEASSGIKLHDALVVDFDNDGFMDLFLVGSPNKEDNRGIALLHNEIQSFSDQSSLIPEHITGGYTAAAGDYNQDGDSDLFIVDLDGRLVLLRNDGGNVNHFLRLQLVGLRTGSGKNNYFGIGAEVEVRAGDLYQKKVLNQPVMLFGIGQREKADLVRILWTNGVPQNIFSPGTDQDLIEEQELKGSCPFLYTWNGEKFVFVKDMMWRSALGMPMGIMGNEMNYAFADASREYLKILGELLKPKDGKYQLQITKELWETIYMDEVKLLAVDHPEDVEIYVDEKFTPPPYPPLDIIDIKNHRKPISALNEKGINIMSLIDEKDGRYVSGFQKTKYQGIVEQHSIILDLGQFDDTKEMYLFLNGWIFPTDASINTAISQNGYKIEPPSLKVMDQNGEWITAIENIGFPAGKDKTIIVNLDNIFLSSDRQLRITTNMEIYWDHIFVGKKNNSRLKITAIEPLHADLHYRGFSRMYRKNGRYGPHWFDYDIVSTIPKWRDLTGTYTSYGDVTELLLHSDDKYIIANAGDETTILFDETHLPELSKGWKRDFLIYSVGWVKDGDLNTATGDTVTPLPFHKMPHYPYGSDVTFPDDMAKQEYLRKYNKRVVKSTDFNKK